MLLTELDGWTPGIIGALAAFADAVMGIGIVVPGEVVITGLGVTAGGVDAIPFVVLVTLGASLGDHVNYGLGRAFGARLAGSRVVTLLGTRHWNRGVLLLERYGPRIIVLTRLIPVIRTLTPAIAGASGLTYRRFLPASLAGSLLWALTWVVAGTVIARMPADIGLVSAFAGVLLAVLVYRMRKRIATSCSTAERWGTWSTTPRLPSCRGSQAEMMSQPEEKSWPEPRSSKR